MVYDGRPSTGCYTCRKRRVKCDEARPNCRQCIRTNKECLGYRDQSLLFFRDETVITERRANRPKRSRSLLEQGSDSSYSSRGDDDQNQGDLIVPQTTLPLQVYEIKRNLSQPLKEQAVGFFFHHFIFAPRHPECSLGHLEYLPSLYHNAKVDSVLPHATMALALAIMVTFSVHRQQIMPLARRTYGIAIAKLNRALHNPVEVRQNETLMTIMLFGIIESLFASTESGHFQKLHIDGAVALLKLRGEELSEDEVASALFLTVRTHMMMNHFQQSKPVEKFFHHAEHGWQYQLTGKLQNVSNRLTQYILLVPALRSRAIYLFRKPRSGSTAQDVLNLLQECQLFDAILSTWPATIPETWQFETVAGDRDCGVSEVAWGDIDIYHDAWVASVWNSYRCARMFLLATIIRCIAWGAPPGIDAQASIEYMLSHERLQDMVNGVCSSVPFLHFGYRENARTIHGTSGVGQHQQPQDSVPPTALACYFLLWPLFVARSASTLPTRQRRWIRGQMEAVAEKLGLAQARALVEIGDKSPERPLFAETWDTSNFENIWEHANLYASGGT